MGNRRQQLAYLFGEGDEETLTAELRGGKGLGLDQLTRFGLPVPPGFTITSTAARARAQEGRFPQRIEWHVMRCMAVLEQRTGRKFGDPERPLLVSVRSGSKESMPGMMDTVLNVGLTSQTYGGLRREFDEEFARGCLVRLESQYRSAVFGGRNKPVPEDPSSQLWSSIAAVVDSWNSERARAYRLAHGIPDWWQTAINVQAMVFGNRGPRSCTGVVFSRDVRNGNPKLYGEFLPQAQGEEVVAGTSTPLPIEMLVDWDPNIYAELSRMVRFLEDRYNDIVDVEFTVEEGKLYLLQCRSAKRSAQAAAAFAVHEVWRDRLPRRQAIQRVSIEQVGELARKSFHSPAMTAATKRRFGTPRLFVKGLPASPGCVTGKAAFTSKEAQRLSREGESVVLFRQDTSPDDLPGMLASDAIVTAIGGETSHAAVVARGSGRVAVVGCKDLKFKNGKVSMSFFSNVREGDIVSVSGDAGQVFLGELPFASADLSKEARLFLRWTRRFGNKFTRSDRRIPFNLLKGRYSANTLLNDFYLTSAMTQMSRGSWLAYEARELEYKTHFEISRIFSCYLFLAIAGEVRFAPAYSSGSNEAISQLIKQFGFSFGGERSEKFNFASEYFNDLSLATQGEFVRLCSQVFKKRRWSSSFGGAKWAAIADALYDFLSGVTNPAVFIDRVFDLRHNGGSLFDKHIMFYEKTEEHYLRSQLDAKKRAGLCELYDALKAYHDDLSPDVRTLWDKGKTERLWKPKGGPK
ncbi:MAG: pyruvate, orthophosphate dikinase [Candidatus Parcubacteria bacterium]|jgi:phosphohistidine swiveling domain-containing protein|nr:pyruvate, orthophosphate dikinase [Candidatus Parcubacteria bacterium]